MKAGFSSLRMRTSLEERPSASDGIGLAERHFEANHRRAVFLLEGLHDAARLHHDHAQRPASQFGAALEDRLDNAIGLFQCDGVMMSLCWPAMLR